MQTDLFEVEETPLSKPMIWTPTRAAGLARLRDFVPAAGLAYARNRNTDLGPNNRSNVSCLSPWLARRLISEQEVVETVLQRHSFPAAEKFVQEVFWRTYWKGWLELRPQVLVDFDRSRQALGQRLLMDTDLERAQNAAQSGQTGIECFDAWANELCTYGWLHNHARMWFASIWIFTLGLPWQLGADFFYKHLLDADAASNTLSWRWVAGLHTKGKHYLARAANIAAHTNGRFNPIGQLNERAEPIIETSQVSGPRLIPQAGVLKTARAGLLITQEDLCPKVGDLGAEIVGAAIMYMPPVGKIDSPRHLFDKGALDDTAIRVEADFKVCVARVASIEEIITWATSLGVSEIVTPYAPTGLVAWRLTQLSPLLAREGICLVYVRRDWDSLAWPLATGGFFKLKEQMPRLIQGVQKLG